VVGLFDNRGEEPAFGAMIWDSSWFSSEKKDLPAHNIKASIQIISNVHIIKV
jgi:hypothetical protein